MLILLDIDMTLVESNHIGVSCLQNAGRELFDSSFSVEGIVFGGGLDPVIIAEMLANNNITPSQAHINAMRSTYHRMLSSLAESQPIANPLPGTHDLVNAVANHPSKPTLGLLTGNYQETGTIKVQSAGFDPALFTINAWGDSSPHPYPTRSHLPPVAIDHYHQTHTNPITPSQVVIIGDTIHDVRCAKDTGCRALAVATGHHDANTLTNAGADLVVDDLTQTTQLLDWILA